MAASETVPARARWRRVGRVVLYVAGGLAGLGVLSVSGLLVAANTDPGRRYLVRETAKLTGGMVSIADIKGRFPDKFGVGRIDVRDRDGVWLSLKDVRLDWSPLALVGLTARINSFTAAELDIPRLPVSEAQTTTSSEPSSLNLGVAIHQVAVRRINVGAPLAGEAASFGLSGHASVASIAPVLNGLSLPSLPGADIALAVRRLDRPGHLSVTAHTSKRTLALHLDAGEEGDGFVASQLGLPQLEPVALQFDLKGPVSAAKLGLDGKAGNVSAHMAGVLDLIGNTMAGLTIKAQAPRMTLSPALGWESMALDASLKGRMAAPEGQVSLDVAQLAAGGVAANTIKLRFTGDDAHKGVAQALRLTLEADGLKVPGKAPTLLAAAPVVLDATWSPQGQGMPLDFTVSHPVFAVAGSARTAAPQKGRLTLTVPDLFPVGQAAGVILHGNAGMSAQFARPDHADGETRLTSEGTLAVTGGQAQAAGLIGPTGHFALDVGLQPVATTHTAPATQHVAFKSLTVDGQALHLTTQGGVTLDRDMDLSASLALPDLSKLLPSLRGDTTLALTAKGALKDFEASLEAHGSPGTATMAPGPVVLAASMKHLPSAPQGQVDLHGTVDRAPLKLNLVAGENEAGDRSLTLDTLSWNTLHGQGALTLPAGQVVPLGKLDIGIDRLADFRAMLGQALSGNLSLGLKSEMVENVPVVSVKLGGTVAKPGMRVGTLALTGSVRDPVAHPDADVALRLMGISVAGVEGQARMTAKGPEDAMALTAAIGPARWGGSPLLLDMAALLDLKDKQVKLQKLNATAREENLHLQGPALVSFGQTMGVDRLRLALASRGSAVATVDVAGRVKPTLALSADIRNLTPGLAKPFMPKLEAEGTVSVSARLSGTLAQPEGTVRLDGNRLRVMGSSAAASFPALGLEATATLARTAAKVQVRLGAGPKLAMQVAGVAPLGARGPLDLRADGRVDLSIANGVLGVQARQVTGVAKMDLRAQGTVLSPQVSGAVDLQNADFQDFASGIHLADINGRVRGAQDRLVIEGLSARAGEGKVDVAGSLGIAAPGMPVDLKLTARGARPVSSDLITAVLDADVAVKGQVQSRVDVSGKVNLRRVEVNIPNSLPTSVARLDVVWPGEKTDKVDQERAASAHAMVVGLDLAVISPGKFFVRGHGLDAEMAGRLNVTGTAQAPLLTGGFDLKRGNFDLAGISLNFTKGRVAFNGAGVGHSLDPTLDFEADRAVNGETARLKVQGYASSPKISFDSLPPRPQEEVLAMLLFGTDARSLSSTQMIELGAAVATLTGLTPFDPMGVLRKTLHLDRLTIAGGSGVGNGGTSVEAGKYVMKGVYVGAKQSTSGSGTQAQVQVDLTKHLKLNTTVGTGGTVTGFTTPENDPGSSVGLMWQYRY